MTRTTIGAVVLGSALLIGAGFGYYYAKTRCNCGH